MSTTEKGLIRTVDELTPEWLAEAIGRPVAELLGTERIGTGQMSHSHRVTFTAGGAVNNNLSVALGGGNLVVTDTAETITTSIAGAVTAPPYTVESSLPGRDCREPQRHEPGRWLGPHRAPSNPGESARRQR